MLHGTYNPVLVVVSVFIASVASYAAFILGERVTASVGSRRFGWLIGGAFAMGLGIWSMHYVGMLAFVLPVPVRYHVSTVGLSLVAAVLASAVALHVVGRKRSPTRQTIFAGFTMGAAICSMHYIGMAAMRSTSMHEYDGRLVTLSVVLAVFFSFVALWLVFHFKHESNSFGWRKVGGSLLMGSGISAMHYTAMAAARFHAPSAIPDFSSTIAVSSLGAAGISATTFMVLATTLLTSWIDRRLMSERLVRHVLESVDILLWQCDPETLTQRKFINPPLKALFGFTSGELQSDTWKDRLHPDDRREVASQHRKAVLSDQPAVVEYRLLAPGSDEIVWVREIVRGIDIGNGRQLLGTTLDITELRRTQEVLVAKEKISVLGRLAATIAHEINNPLAAVGNILFLAQSRSDLPVDLQQHLHIAEQELRRAADITRHALSFARGDKTEVDVDLEHLLRDLLRVYNSQMNNKRLRLETAFQVAFLLRANPGELRQVLANLISNAIDAAPPGGLIRIRTLPRLEHQNGFRRGVLIVVADTGPGIPKHLRERIFEPFFTTKKDVGTGLGLWIVRELVTKQHGWVKVRSLTGVGTVFNIFLPLSAGNEPQHSSLA